MSADVATKTEQAVANFLATALGRTVYTGLNSDPETFPAVVAYVALGEEGPLDTGNYVTDTRVRIVSRAQRDTDEEAPPHIAARLLYGQVVEQMKWDDLRVRLTDALADFTCFLVLDRGFSSGIEDGFFVQELRFELHVCALDIALS